MFLAVALKMLFRQNNRQGLSSEFKNINVKESEDKIIATL
jgi:hypothetical protein